MTVHFTITLSIIVSLYNIDAFSLNSYLGHSSGSKLSSIRRRTYGLNDRTALHIWKSKEEEQTVLVESKREQETPSIVKITDKFPSLGKLGDFNNFLRTETDDIWEEELSVADQGTNGNSEESQNLASFVAVGAIASIAFLLGSQYLSVDSNLLQGTATEFQQIFSNPTETLENAVSSISSMGPLGVFYFCVIYVIAEILAIPAFPLTASAGYLFGVKEGTLAVLFSASIAAAVSFVIGRTLLRDYVEGVLEENPKFKQLDKAIGKEGFKLMLLLRLSPIFPFALSNYLYGATSVRFWPYFFGTMLGFTPGTIAYVYTGEVGKALTLESATAEPWYVYLGGLALISGFVKIAADVATGIIDDLEKEDES